MAFRESAQEILMLLESIFDPGILSAHFTLRDIEEHLEIVAAAEVSLYTLLLSSFLSTFFTYLQMKSLCK